MLMPTLINHQPAVNLTQATQQLNTSLRAFQPQNSEAVSLIIYTLIGAALVGIFMYHYIKSQEETN
jgi:hypothetical protein